LGGSLNRFESDSAPREVSSLFVELHQEVKLTD
jgi:hypothetical protein